MCVTSICQYHLPIMPDKGRMVFSGSPRTWTKAWANSWLVCGATWHWMERDMMPQMCSIRFRFGERAGQSIASMASSCRNCWHTPATWGLALSCIRRNPGPTAAAYGLKGVWRSHLSQATSAKHMEGCAPPKKCDPQTSTDPLPKRVMLEAVAGSRMFSTASPDSVTCANMCEPAFIWRAQGTNGEFANIGALWQMTNVPHGVELSAQPPPMDVRPS